MARHISEIIKELVTSLSEEVKSELKKELRDSYVQDVKQIVKEELKNDVVYQGAGSGFLTIEAICDKYKVSRQTVHNKCSQFHVERKQVGKHKLVNEAQFLVACEQPAPKLSFIKKE